MKNIELVNKAKEIRRLTLECIASIGSGHIGGSLSIADVLAVLYFKEMNIDPKNPKKCDRDKLVLSKGHAGPGLYATLAHRGYFPENELLTLNKLGTHLPSHCDMTKTIGVDMTAGSLGQGISCAVGFALAARINSYDSYTYAIVGDGECQEGEVWEAAMLASHQKLDHLIVFLDNNKIQLDGFTKDIIDPLDFKAKWESFGFYTQEIDGHNVDEIVEAIEKAKTVIGKPKMIILDTIKGKGVKFVEAAAPANHSMPVSKENLEIALKDLQ